MFPVAISFLLVVAVSASSDSQCLQAPIIDLFDEVYAEVQQVLESQPLEVRHYITELGEYFNKSRPEISDLATFVSQNFDLCFGNETVLPQIEACIVGIELWHWNIHSVPAEHRAGVQGHIEALYPVVDYSAGQRLEAIVASLENRFYTADMASFRCFMIAPQGRRTPHFNNCEGNKLRQYRDSEALRRKAFGIYAPNGCYVDAYAFAEIGFFSEVWNITRASGALEVKSVKNILDETRTMLNTSFNALGPVSQAISWEVSWCLGTTRLTGQAAKDTCRKEGLAIWNRSIKDKVNDIHSDHLRLLRSLYTTPELKGVMNITSIISRAYEQLRAGEVESYNCILNE